jgi:hypothetical protein
LGKAINRLDILKFFIQLTWEQKLVNNEKYLEISKELENIGKQLGGWKKGLEIKNSQNKLGEK